jgi:saccharopine dehydrogenase-like NADP-dependent oxidoreductase
VRLQVEQRFDRELFRKGTKMSRVVVFGAGLVVRAHVRYLLDHGFDVTVASRTVGKAEAILAGHPRGTPMAFDIAKEPERLDEIVAAHDLAVSLLPWQYHPKVAASSVAHGKTMVTTSYVKDEMKALDGPAKDAGVMLLNELGVDPGIDHMTAMQVIHRVQAAGGTITTFQSYCGGLPAPEANDNPFGYKFSWSPRGVLLAGLNDASYRMNGADTEVPGAQLFDHIWTVPVEVEGRVIEFKGYPNRDSMPYTDYYGIDPAQTMFRGTLRNPHWCAIMKQVARLGWLRTDDLDGLDGATFTDVTARLLGVDGTDDVKSVAADRLGLDPAGAEIAGMEWVGLFSDEPLPDAKAPVDILTARMLDTMSYAEGERDMLVLQHTFIAEYTGRREKIISTMVDFGIPGGDSSMNRTVGLPAAVAARFALEGRFHQPGVVVPVMPELYEPVLAELGRLGITFTESVEDL